jgi:ribonuclease P protein component
MVGLKVSKKAVDRNKIKRQIREIFKQYNEKILYSYDIVAIALPAIKNADYKEIESSISFSLRRLRLLNK